MKLDGSTVVVTGGARRIGRHVAERFASRGANIVLNYHTSQDEAAEAVHHLRSNGIGAIAVQADVSTYEGVVTLRETAIERFGSVEVLINNASVYYPTPFDELTEGDWEDNISVNLRGPYLGCWLFGQHMLDRGKGNIINVTDWGVERPYTNYAPYFVAKGAVVALTKVMAKELAPTVLVNAVAPGPVLLPEDFTPEMISAIAKATLVKRIGSPEDIAQAMLFLVEGSDFITGAIIPVDGGRQVV